MLNFSELPRTAPRIEVETHAYLPTDPRAEGARARRAGLAAADNPYLLWACAAKAWADGWKLGASA